MTRKKARELLMRIVFQMEAQKDTSDAPLLMHLSETEVDDLQRDYIADGYHAIAAHLSEIDKAIADHTTRWDISRLPKTELAILRIAIAEMWYLEDIPAGAAINEAVELAKQYGGEEKAGAFVNGMLGRILREEES